MNAPWSCQYFLYACNDPTADNYVSAFNTLAANLHLNGNGVIASPMPPATVLAGMCQYGGCNDTAATNYNSRVRCAPVPSVPVCCHASSPASPASPPLPPLPPFPPIRFPPSPCHHPSFNRRKARIRPRSLQ